MNNINKFDICYIIKLDQNPTERTYFFHIDTSKLQKISLIKMISKLPINIQHPLCELEQMVESKIFGISNGHAIRFIYEWEQINTIPYQHKVVFSQTPPPHPYIDTVCYIEENVGLTETQLEENALKYLAASLQKQLNYNPKAVDMKKVSINASLYNMSTLMMFESNKYQFTLDDDSDAFNKELINTHSNTFEYIIQLDCYKDFKNSNKFKSIITDFSIDNYFVLNKKELTKSKLRKEIGNDEKADMLSETLILAKNSIFKNGTYDVNFENEEFKKFIKEMEYIEMLIGVYSSATFSSTLKTDCYVNDVYTDMNELEAMESRRGYNSNVKVLAARISNKLTNKSVNIIPFIEGALVYPLKIISNLPLEWIRVNRLPLMINSPVSRIPKTPVHLLENLTLERNFNISLDYHDIYQVLIISAFEDTDSLKGQLKSYIDKIVLNDEIAKEHDRASWESINPGKQPYNFNINYKTAGNIEELCTILNESTENIVIFDMHGNHKDDQEGYVAINNTRVTISSLLGRVTRIPPIVILSSCNTSAINRNSYTFSNGLLALGAFSVLGSALPINGHESCRFITRLLLRIKLYLPEYFRRNNTINWSKFIHGMIKREYFTDLINHLESAKFIKSKEDKAKINNEVGIVLENYFNPDLMDGILQIISSITNNEFEQVSKEIEDNFFYAEAIKYFHLGNPENIVVHKSLAAHK
ncbi:TPA: CHAT domain-containing protein [Providencia rettgeri]|nr:CHAT domain-containing protein [Providencia rettgeri]